MALPPLILSRSAAERPGDRLDQVDRVLLAHVERVVRPEDDPRGAHHRHQVRHEQRLEHQVVDPDPVQVLGGRARDRVHLRADLVAVDGPREVRRQVAAPVRRHDVQHREPLQDAAEDQVRQRDRRVQRVPDDVAQVVLRDSLAEGGPGRVDEDRGAVLLGGGPERVERRIVQVHVLDARPDLDAAHPERGHRRGKLLRGQRRELERDVAEPHEAVPVGRHDLGDVLVRGGHDLV